MELVGYCSEFVDAPGLVAEEVRIAIVVQRSEGYYVVCPRTAKLLGQAVLGSTREEEVAFAEPGAGDSYSSHSWGTRAHPMSGA